MCKNLIPGYDPFATKGECWFDAKAAQRAVDFFPRCLKHVEGAVANQPFVLEPWQQAFVGNLFGWKRKNAQGRTVRRYRESLLYVSRKNGKTPLVAGLAAYVLFCETEQAQQNYIAASMREQAGFLFRHLKGMVESEPVLKNMADIYGGRQEAGQSRSIVRKSDSSFVRVISADAFSKHGGNPHLTIIDELHAQPSPELYDVLRSAMVSQNRAEPLFLSITTADYDRPSICNERHNYACQVRDGLVNDPTFLPVIYETPQDADWTSPKVWKAANPNIGVSVSKEELHQMCETAKIIPRKENEFKRLHLNMRTQTDERWLSLESWDASDVAFEESELIGRPCWCGLDLSTTTDLSAFAMVFVEGERKYRVLLRFWVPGDGIYDRGKRDNVPYETWIKQGFIEPTPGNSIDYTRIRRDINELGERFQVKEIAADRWNATQIITELGQDGFTIFGFGQGFKDMSPAAKELERAIIAGDVSCNRNPVMRWMVSNAKPDRDAADNVKPHKGKSTGRIDGVVATIMGIARASLNGSEYSSCYERLPGLRSV